MTMCCSRNPQAFVFAALLTAVRHLMCACTSVCMSLFMSACMSACLPVFPLSCPQVPVFKRYGWFYKAFRWSTWYWEAVINSRKFTFVLCVQLPLQTLTILQILMVICLMSLLLQRLTRPYNVSAVNEIQSLSIIGIAFTVVCARASVIRLKGALSTCRLQLRTSSPATTGSDQGGP